MKYSITKFFLFLSLFFVAQCNNKKSKISTEEAYLKRDIIQEWQTYFSEIQHSDSTDSIALKNSLILVAYPTFCGDCLNEIKFWDNFFSSRKDLDGQLYLIVVEKFDVRYSQFISDNEFTMTTFKDKESEIRNRDLVPYLPAKIFFNKDQSPIVLGLIDSKNLTELSKVIDHQLQSN